MYSRVERTAVKHWGHFPALLLLRKPIVLDKKRFKWQNLIFIGWRLVFYFYHCENDNFFYMYSWEKNSLASNICTYQHQSLLYMNNVLLLHVKYWKSWRAGHILHIYDKLTYHYLDPLRLQIYSPQNKNKFTNTSLILQKWFCCTIVQNLLIWKRKARNICLFF